MRCQLFALVAACALAACSQSGASGGCQSNADCPPGDLCNRGHCQAPRRGGTSGANLGGSSGGNVGGASSGGNQGASTSAGAGSTGQQVSGGSSSGGNEGGSSSGGGIGGSSSGGGGGGSTSGGGGSTTGSAAGGSSSSGGNSGGAITCSAPDNSYKQNGGGCGTERWAVKTGTDDDVSAIDMVPQIATVAQVDALPDSPGGTCTRQPPTEEQVYELQNVNLEFHDEESDSDYHIVVTDNQGGTLIAEIPFPGCVQAGGGSDNCGTTTTPLLCAITHARANFETFKPSSNNTPIGVGTVVGVGFFDPPHGQTGKAPNNFEVHPVLAICKGQDCDPFAGY